MNIKPFTMVLAWDGISRLKNGEKYYELVEFIKYEPLLEDECKYICIGQSHDGKYIENMMEIIEYDGREVR